MPNLTDADKVLRNDTGISIANRLSEIAATLDSQGGTSLAATDIADLYDNTKTYIVGDYVINNQALYRCIEDITTPEDFDSTKWRAIKIMSAVNEEIDSDIRSLLPIDSASGNPCNFETGIADKLVSLSAEIAASGGGGTPDNPNPINGYSEANIVNTQNDSIVDLFSIDSDFRGTVAFNQLASFSSGDIPSASHGITYSSDDNKSVTINGTANGGELRTGWFNLSESTDLTPDKLGHKFALISKIISGSYNGIFEIKLGNSAFYNVGESFITTLEYSISQSQQIRFSTNIYNGTICDNLKVTFICVDLTAMFGSTVADYIYGLERATAGAGVAFFRSIYPADYYDYDVGTNELVGKIIPNATIAFGQTVYGGVLDVTRGKLTVTHKGDVLDINDKLSITNIGNCSRIAFRISNAPANVNTDICSIATYLYDYSSDTPHFYCVGLAVDNNVCYLFVDNNDISSLTTFTVCYKLATPFDIDLTPEVISAVVGTNNVYSDTNGNTTVQFKDSIQHYIDSKIAG